MGRHGCRFDFVLFGPCCGHVMWNDSGKYCQDLDGHCLSGHGWCVFGLLFSARLAGKGSDVMITIFFFFFFFFDEENLRLLYLFAIWEFGGTC